MKGHQIHDISKFLKSKMRLSIAILFLIMINSCKNENPSRKDSLQGFSYYEHDCFCDRNNLLSVTSRDSMDYGIAFTKFYFEDSKDGDSVLYSLDSVLKTKMNLKDTSELFYMFKKVLNGKESYKETYKILQDSSMDELSFYVREISKDHREVIDSSYVRADKITKVRVGDKFENVYTNPVLCEKYKTKVSFVLKWVTCTHTSHTSESKIDKAEIIFANNQGKGYDVVVDQPILGTNR